LKKKTVIIILGPTAVGKTAGAIRLAMDLGTKIISADSRQCFKELNIGVAKPAAAELQAVHHYFINSHSIREDVNAALFEELALGWTEEIFRWQEGKTAQPGKAGQSETLYSPFSEHPVAVMVGGTGLYIKAFCEGLDEMPAIDPAIRQKIGAQYAKEGINWLQEQIREHDPAFYKEGEILNPQRLMRALEVKLSTGRSILDFRGRQKRERPFEIRKIGLQLPKEELHRRINYRVDGMMEQGLLDEVRGLASFKDLNALQTVGYSELFAFLESRCSLDEAVETIKKHTRHYAKRQMTWFRKDPAVQWVDANEFQESPVKYITG
jgi:tRNA dimethylallyltransferase